MSSAKHSLKEAAAPTSSESAMHNKEQCLKNYETVFTNVKAGMQGVDRDKVKQIVYEMSKDSAHFHEEQRKQV
jgi:DNA polymerase kappa